MSQRTIARVVCYEVVKWSGGQVVRWSSGRVVDWSSGQVVKNGQVVMIVEPKISLTSRYRGQLKTSPTF